MTQKYSASIGFILLKPLQPTKDAKAKPLRPLDTPERGSLRVV